MTDHRYSHFGSIKRKRIGLVVGYFVVFIILVAVILVVKSRRNQRCKLVDEIRWDNETKVNNIPSPDFKNLASFVGQLSVRYLGDTENLAYLPILLNSIYVHVDDKTHEYKLHMESECSLLTFTIGFTSSWLKDINRIDMEVDIGGARRELCTIHWPNLLFNNGSHLECDTRKRYNCESRFDAEYLLTIDKIAVELDGDPAIIRGGHYSKPARKC